MRYFFPWEACTSICVVIQEYNNLLYSSYAMSAPTVDYQYFQRQVTLIVKKFVLLWNKSIQRIQITAVYVFTYFRSVQIPAQLLKL